MSNNKEQSSAAANDGQTSNSPPKKKNKIWLLIFPLIIAAVALAVVLQKTQKEASVSDQPSSPSASGDPASAGSPDDPARSPAIPPRAEDSEPIAQVNKRPILKKNFDEMLNMSQSQQMLNSEENQPSEPSMELKLEVLDSLINLNLAIQQAYALGFGPSADEIEDGINQLLGNYGNREEIENALSAFGTDIQTVRSQVADSLAVRSWRDTAFIKAALATDEEAKAFYDSHLEEASHPEQVRVVQIMLPVPLNNGQEDPQAKARVKARAEAIFKEAQEGANFEELMERNMDQATRAATSSGQMGWVNRGSSSFEELEDIIFNLNPGDIGGPVESQFSYHIVKVMEKRPAGVMSFEELKADILDYLLGVKTDQLFLRTISDYRKEADIEIFDQAMAAAWPAFQASLSSQIPPADQEAGDGPSQAVPERPAD